MYAEIDIDISYLTEKLSRVVYTLKCKKNKHKVFSSLNKRSTENALNWSPSCFVTAAVLPDVFSTAKSGIPFLRSPWVSCLGSMCTAWCTVLHEHRVTRLNRWESNKTKMGRDRWPNNIEGYMYCTVEKASSSSHEARWGPIQHSLSYICVNANN